MSRLHTHYDNLMVARNASPEVIRAAYKTLSQKFHPDLHPNNPEAERIMKVINVSYAILSDPGKRQQHDLWIQSREEARAGSGEASSGAAPSKAPVPPNINPHRSESRTMPLWRMALAFATGNWAWLLLIGLIWLVVSSSGGKRAPPSKPYTPSTPDTAVAAPTPEKARVPAEPKYTRPLVAPNGTPWPTAAGYVQQYKRLHTDGLSSVTVDNSRNDSDVFVKLVSAEGENAYPVRQFFIPARSSFKVESIRAGSYDVRYRDLDTGGLSRSEPFSLQEITSYNGIEYSNVTMTLYKVRHGNMQTYGISEDEF